MDPMLTLMQIAALATAGMCFALLGSVKLPLARKLQIDEGKVGGLVAVFGFTLVPMVVVAGFLVDLVGKQAVLGGGFLLVVISLVVLAHSRRYAAALVAVLVLGTGWSALVNVLNVTSPPAFVPPDDLPQRMAYAMNMGDFIFGVGTFVTPLIIVSCAQRFGLTRTLYGFAAVSVNSALLRTGRRLGSIKSGSERIRGWRVGEAIVRSHCLDLFGGVFLSCARPKRRSPTWATTLMIDKNVSEAKASTLLSVFWMTFMGSRLVTALTLPEGAAATLVVVMACCSVAITLGIVFCRGTTLMRILIVVAGAVVGPIFPTLIAILLAHVEPSLHGRAVGIFFCIGGIGWTAIPILIGLYAKRTTVQRGFLIASGSAVVLCALSIVLALRLT